MVWIETWPIQFLLGSSSPPAAWHNLAQVLLSLPIPAFAAGNARLWPAFFWWANQEKMAACARRSQIGITRATAEVLVAGLAGAPCSTAASSIFVAPPDNFWMRRYPGVMCGLVSSPRGAKHRPSRRRSSRHAAYRAECRVVQSRGDRVGLPVFYMIAETSRITAIPNRGRRYRRRRCCARRSDYRSGRAHTNPSRPARNPWAPP